MINRNTKKKIDKLIAILIVSLFFVSIFNEKVIGATETSVNIEGKVYTFPSKKSSYDFSSEQCLESVDALGTFSISGSIISSEDNNGLLSLGLKQDDLRLSYQIQKDNHYSKNEWELVEDNSKKIMDIDLSEKIRKGAIVIQTSRDGEKWANVNVVTNAFEELTDWEFDKQTNDMQLTNGFFYRTIIAYEVRKNIEPKNFLFFDTSKYEYQKVLEIYNFYAKYEDIESSIDQDAKKHYFNSKPVKVSSKGYDGNKDIDDNDNHYGWLLGDFVISGFTSKTEDLKQHQVFLKNPGDKIILSFDLEQDISKIDGDSKLIIADDNGAYDKFFQTKKTDFRKGAIIIRKTNYENKEESPIIYTDFLESASMNSDTVVRLFEEGDYEVVLDYKVKKKDLIDKDGYYRLGIEFSVRNSGCIFFPFDIKTGGELRDGSYTENGFYIDLAKSRYLRINVTRQELKRTSGGYVLDTRMNREAKDGDEYTDEGIYVISVKNEYTNQEESKTIYVGGEEIREFAKAQTSN